MVDIHAHILPGLDDGSKSMAMSLEMAELALRSGVTDLIATPHSNQRRRFENYASDALQGSFLRLQETLRRERLDLRVYPGMEVFATPDLVELYRAGKLLTLANSRYLLVEFSFSEEIDFIWSILRGLLEIGVTPIVAHPERYDALQNLPDILCDWVDAGVHLQINKGSLFGSFGTPAERMAVAMLQHDLVSFVASDAHRADRRTPVLSDAFHWLSLNMSERIAMMKCAERSRFDRVGDMIVAVSYGGSFEASGCRALLQAGADVVYVASQRDDAYRISARATQDMVRRGVNLGQIFKELGHEVTADGGGHGGAAGISGIGDCEAILHICMQKTMDIFREIKRRSTPEQTDVPDSEN